MGENKKIRKQIASLIARVTEHEIKIAEELIREQPNWGVIRKWETEINSWQEQINHKSKRLPDWRKP
ncbi:MAG: hypothetical protein RLZZ156_2319 [Deinococcota bacterium]|jgi:hypothetical protein